MVGKEFNNIESSNKKIREKNLKSIECSFIKTHQLDKSSTIGSIDIDIDIKQGEILGLAGLLGSGRTEIAKLIFGIDKADHGTIKIKNKEYSYTKINSN